MSESNQDQSSTFGHYLPKLISKESVSKTLGVQNRHLKMCSRRNHKFLSHWSWKLLQTVLVIPVAFVVLNEWALRYKATWCIIQTSLVWVKRGEFEWTNLVEMVQQEKRSKIIRNDLKITRYRKKQGRWLINRYQRC